MINPLDIPFENDIWDLFSSDEESSDEQELQEFVQNFVEPQNGTAAKAQSEPVQQPKAVRCCLDCLPTAKSA